MSPSEIGARKDDVRLNACSLAALAKTIVAWLATCRDYYAAAMLYEELSRLSDTELARRGLDRASLAKDLCERQDTGRD
jgi:hypothetical protein